MRPMARQILNLALTVGVVAATLSLPTAVDAKVYLYALTWGGGLVKYDPDVDQVTQVSPYVGQGFITQRDTDSIPRAPTRILDVARQRIVTFTEQDPGVALLDLQAKRATPIQVAPLDTISELLYIIYPRQASRFYIQWLRRPAGGGPDEPMLTAVDLTGTVLSTSPSLIPYVLGGATLRPDGRSFYVSISQPKTVLLVDAETLAIQARYDLSPFGGPAPVGIFGVGDVQDDRVIMGARQGLRQDRLDPGILLTVDLRTLTATPRISTSFGLAGALLLPGGSTILIQEPQPNRPDSVAGSGQLHFLDLATGTEVGTLAFRADRGAVLLGLHPDGRRAFFRVWNTDDATGTRAPYLVIVDVVSRTVVRNRPFSDITSVVDFVDEP